MTAELAARRTAAAAVLADFRRDLASAPRTSPPPMATWALRLADVLGQLLDEMPRAAEPVPTRDRTRRAAALLAEVPASQRAAEGHRDDDEAAAVARVLAARPDDVAAIVTGWLRAARLDHGKAT